MLDHGRGNPAPHAYPNTPSGLTHRPLAYALAAGLSIATLFIRLMLGLGVNDPPILVLFTFPIMLSAYSGGLGPGLMATLLTTVLTNFVLLPPHYAFSLSTELNLLESGSLLVAGIVISALSEGLHRTQQRAEASRELLRVTLASIGDGVISTDTAGRIRFLNAEAARLTGWSEAEAIGQPLSSVFRIVNAQTRAPVEHPAAKVLRSGEVAGLANHTLLLSRDGHEAPIDDSGAPIRHTNGAVAGVVLVFRDVSAREQAEAALHISETRFHHTIDSMLEGFQIIDFDWRYRYLNESAARQGQQPRASLIGRTMMECYPGIETTELFHELRRCMDERISHRMENRFDYGDGSSAWFDLSIQPGPDGIFVLSIDITERKRAEAALRQSEARFATIFRVSPAAMSITRLRDGHFIDVNASYEQLFEYTREELLGQHIGAVDFYLNPEQRAEIVGLLREHGPLHSYEVTLRAKSGELREVLFSSDALELDNQACVLGIAFDITARKRAEQALHHSAERLRVLADASRIFAEGSADDQRLLDQVVRAIAEALGDFCVIRLLSKDGQWLTTAALYNAAADALDAAQQALAAAPTPAGAMQPLWDVLAGDRALILPELDLAQLAATLHPAEEQALEYINDYVRVVAPLRISGQPTGLLSVIRKRRGRPPFDDDDLRLVQDLADRAALAIAKAQLLHQLQQELAERQKAEAQVRQLNAELEARVAARTAELSAANRELEAFSYSVSHDLRAPLRAIDGLAGILLEEYTTSLPEEGQEYFTLIRTNAQQMGQLVDDLLAFSRLSRQALRTQSVDTAALARQCLRELQAEQVGRQVEIRIGELPRCQGDPALLKQVWFNLLSNALKYTRKREVAQIMVGSQAAGSETIYFVKDNGAGFDMRYADKLFGVFQRLHRAEEYEGTGAGLAIVQRIVQRHGGRVWAAAAVEQGATFFFTLGPSSHREAASQGSVG